MTAEDGFSQEVSERERESSAEVASSIEIHTRVRGENLLVDSWLV